MKTQGQIYLIADNHTCWGAGLSEDEAITQAAQCLCDSESGAQGITIEQVESMMITERESRNGEDGVYLIHYQDKWPDNAKLMDGDAWLRHYWKSN